MDLDELEATRQNTTPESGDDGEFDPDEDQQLLDLKDAVLLLGLSMRLLNYVGDVELCKTLSKRDRDAMDRVATKIREFLDEVEPGLSEG